MLLAMTCKLVSCSIGSLSDFVTLISFLLIAVLFGRSILPVLIIVQ